VPLSILLLTGSALAAPDIPMDAVFDALAGRGPAPDLRVVQAPVQLDGLARPPLPFPEKQLYGGRMDNHVDSENFTVAWNHGEATQEVGELVSQTMEEAWQALVEEQDWTQPVSSDIYMLWVLLDPWLNGTGLTTVYNTELYPQGYPVIYINPYYVFDEAFFRSLCAHEFNHALQFALRDWSSGEDESWYWEASAEWGAELALPDENAYANSSVYYSWYPWYRYSSTEDYHQYGMFVLNAYLEEHVTGSGGMRRIWELSTERAGVDWADILAESAGESAADIWGGFTAAMGNDGLREQALYEPVLIDGTLSDGFEGRVALLGTDYFTVDQRASVSVSTSVQGEEVMISGPSGWGAVIDVSPGDVLGITGLSDPDAGYLVSFGDPLEQDTGGDGDSGELADTGGRPPSLDSGPAGDRPFQTGDDAACGCGTGAGGAAWLALLFAGLLRRRTG